MVCILYNSHEINSIALNKNNHYHFRFVTLYYYIMYYYYYCYSYYYCYIQYEIVPIQDIGFKNDFFKLIATMKINLPTINK